MDVSKLWLNVLRLIPMPANPDNIDRREVLSGDYHDEKVTIDFYTNSSVYIYRGDEDMGDGVWLDNLEKRELLDVLDQEITKQPPPIRYYLSRIMGRFNPNA